MKGMMEFLTENFKNKNAVYSENTDIPGMGHAFTPFKFEDWIERDQAYMKYEQDLKGVQ